ncbi:MAG: GTPase, partial [Actinomycetota bacterium]
MTKQHRVPAVVIVGRPNVGKSTWFNRVIGEQAAIVEDRPGVTRDRFTRRASWLGREFDIVDTGGWLPSGSELDDKVSRQVEEAVRSADLVIFMVDASVGLTDEDEAVADWLRRTDVPVILAANKSDNDRRELERWSFMSLGLGEPYPVSALHDEVEEIAAAAAVERTDGIGLTQAEGHEGPPLQLTAVVVRLVGGEDDRHVSPPQPVRDGLVFVGETDGRVDHEDHEVRRTDRLLDLAAHLV